MTATGIALRDPWTVAWTPVTPTIWTIRSKRNGGRRSMSEPKSRTIELRVDGEILAEFIGDHFSVEITRYQVSVVGSCRDTYQDKVLLNSDALERFGYAPDGSDLPEPAKPWWWHLLQAFGARHV